MDDLKASRHDAEVMDYLFSNMMEGTYRFDTRNNPYYVFSEEVLYREGSSRDVEDGDPSEENGKLF